MRSPTAWRKPGIGSSPSPALDPSQWKSARTTNAIERLNEEFPPPHQDADRAALRRNRADVALGAARLRSDPAAQGRWMADAFLNRSNRSSLPSPPEKRNLHMPGTRRQGISTRYKTRPSSARISRDCAKSLLKSRRSSWLFASCQRGGGGGGGRATVCRCDIGIAF